MATNEDELKYLMQTKVNVGSGCSLCMICGKAVSQKNVKRHFQSFHFDDGMAYKCPVCPTFTCKSQDNFQTHIYKVHPNLKGINYAQCKVPRPAESFQ